MKKILNKTISILSRRAHFSKELKEKLKEKGFENGEIDLVISKVQKQGWLNDLELAEQYIESLKRRGYGKRVILQKLRLKAGLEILEQVDFGEESYDEISSLIEKKYRRDLPEKKDRVIRALLRRGYSYDLVLQALSSQNSQDDL